MVIIALSLKLFVAPFILTVSQPLLCWVLRNKISWSVNCIGITYTERLKAFVFFAPLRNLQRQQNTNKQPFFSSGHAKPVKKLISIWVGSPGMSSPEKFRKIWKIFHYLICLKKEFEASLLFGLTMDKLSACLQREKTDIR